MAADKANKPRFRHDCDECIYLGRASGEEMDWGVPEVDLYLHPRGRQYVMRFGSDGPQYCSGDVENDPSWPRSYEVYKRALARGLIDEMLEGSRFQWLQPGDPVDFSKPFRIRIGG